MDFINQASAQISALFRSMSAGARITAGLLLAVIVISLGYLFNHQMAAPDAYLLGGEPFSSNELPAIQGALGKAGLKSFTMDGNRIRVPRGEEATYMAALADANVLPANYGSYLQRALADGGPFTSKNKQAELLKVAKQDELARVIRHMRGVGNTSVLMSEKEDGGLTRKKVYSASVSVSTIGGMPLEPAQVRAIRNLVAGSTAGMSPESVAVIDLLNNHVYTPQDSSGTMGGENDPYNQTKLAHEKAWNKKILDALSYVPGVLVTCNVELNTEIEHIKHTTQLDPKPVPVSISEESRTSNSQGAGPAGRPGLPAQGGLNAPTAIGSNSAGARSEEESSSTQQQNKIAGSEDRIKMAALTPNRITAAIGVPSSYIEMVWRKEHPTPADAEPKKPTDAELKIVDERETKKIQDHIASLLDLPKQTLPNPVPQVKVTTFAHLPGPELAMAGVSDQALAWFGSHWSTIGTGILGLVSLVMLRSMVKNVPAPQPVAVNAEATTNETERKKEDSPQSIAEQKGAAVNRLRRKDKTGPTMKDELVEIVREDPDAAANVLRSWIMSNS